MRVQAGVQTELCETKQFLQPIASEKSGAAQVWKRMNLTGVCLLGLLSISSVFSCDAGRTSDRTLLGSPQSSPVISVNINTTFINFHLLSEQRDRFRSKVLFPAFYL